MSLITSLLEWPPTFGGRPNPRAPGDNFISQPLRKTMKTGLKQLAEPVGERFQIIRPTACPASSPCPGWRLNATMGAWQEGLKVRHGHPTRIGRNCPPKSHPVARTQLSLCASNSRRTNPWITLDSFSGPGWLSQPGVATLPTVFRLFATCVQKSYPLNAHGQQPLV